MSSILSAPRTHRFGRGSGRRPTPCTIAGLALPLILPRPAAPQAISAEQQSSIVAHLPAELRERGREVVGEPDPRKRVSAVIQFIRDESELGEADLESLVQFGIDIARRDPSPYVRGPVLIAIGRPPFMSDPQVQHALEESATSDPDAGVSLRALETLRSARIGRRGELTPMAQDSTELEAIHALLSQYRSTQDAGDLLGQAELMTPDRVWINQAGVRRTDNAENMRVQQMEADSQRERLPGLKTITMDRDVLIKFYAEGEVAIVSFYRTAFRFYPPGTSKDLREEYGPGSETGTLVLERRNGEWKIVHTHWSGS